MTTFGLVNLNGTVFSVDTFGLDKVLHGFSRFRGGFYGCKSLTVSGTEFYGMASYGADSNLFGNDVGGVIFKLVDTGIYYPQVTFNTIDISCNGGSNGAATADVSGGVSPYTYLWQPSGNTTNSIGGLSAGTYTLSVTGNNDSTTTENITITEPAVLSASIYVIANITCAGSANGVDSVVVSGGTSPFTYLWSDANSQTTVTATGLSAGTYTVTVNDSCGDFTTITDTINPPGALSAIASTFSNVTCIGAGNGISTVTVIVGSAPFTYLWSDANSQTNATQQG
jgi:hypothetical protein